MQTQLTRPPYLKANAKGVWEIRWSGGGRSKRKSTKTQDVNLAQRRLGIWLSDTGKEPDKTDLRVKDCLYRYWSGHVRTKTVDVARIKSILRWLDQSMGHIAIDNLRDDHINEYIEARSEGQIGTSNAGMSTVRRELSCLRSALNYCVKQRLITAANLPHIPLPAIAKHRAFWLSEDQVNVMLAYLDEDRKEGFYSQVHLFVVLGLATGSRKTAIENLTWEQVDFGQEVIRFDMQVKVETRKRKVAVPMSDWLRDILKGQVDGYKDHYVLGSNQNIRHAFNTFKTKLVKATGDTEYARMTPHTLRHTAATQMLRHGVSLWQVAGILGDSVETVANIYGHHVKEHLKDAANTWKIGEK